LVHNFSPSPARFETVELNEMVIILVVADDHFRGGIGNPGLPGLIVTRLALSGPQRVKATVEQKIHELDQTIAIS
jgi:hypothetical protein